MEGLIFIIIGVWLLLSWLNGASSNHKPSSRSRVEKPQTSHCPLHPKQDGDAKSVLLRTQGSQKFSFEGELLDIVKVDVIYIAIVSIGQQIVEVVLDESEARDLHVGSVVSISTKAFAPIIKMV